MKFYTDKQEGCNTIIDKNTSVEYQSIREALEYVFLEKFLAKCRGECVTVRLNDKYPVKSLIPETAKKRVIFRDLGEEQV